MEGSIRARRKREDGIMKARVYLITCGILLGAAGSGVLAQETSPAQEEIAALKQSLQSSAAALHHYEWLETTTIYIGGEEKGVKKNQCSYGADGTLVKVPLGTESSASGGRQPRGLRKAIAENKKQDIENSVKEAAAVIHQYVPPDPTKIEAAKQAGRIAIIPPDAQGNLSLKITDYLKQGDSLDLGWNADTNAILSLTVASYTEKQKDTVNLQVAFGTLNDGTQHPSRIVLDLKADDLQLVIENSNYQKTES